MRHQDMPTYYTKTGENFTIGNFVTNVMTQFSKLGRAIILDHGLIQKQCGESL